MTDSVIISDVLCSPMRSFASCTWSAVLSTSTRCINDNIRILQLLQLMMPLHAWRDLQRYRKRSLMSMSLNLKILIYMHVNKLSRSFEEFFDFPRKLFIH